MEVFFPIFNEIIRLKKSAKIEEKAIENICKAKRLLSEENKLSKTDQEEK